MFFEFDYGMKLKDFWSGTRWGIKKPPPRNSLMTWQQCKTYAEKEIGANTSDGIGIRFGIAIVGPNLRKRLAVVTTSSCETVQMGKDIRKGSSTDFRAFPCLGLGKNIGN
uniref:PEPCK_GTP domain-containing protein n=1 Tax=Panagrellus redivivus TaxID=6233 RepID=A0A7E4V5I3_PANRE